MTREAEAWDQFCETLRRAQRLVLDAGLPDSPRERAEGLRYLTRFLAAGINLCIEHADPDHPELCRMMDRGITWGLDCPDCLYLYASVRGGAAYRIWGARGSANHLDVQVNHGHFASGDIAAWGTIASLSGLELESAPDGSFELFLGGERRPRNWLPLAPGAEFVLLRQYFNDWEAERPADLQIERLGAPVPVPPPSANQMAARLARLCEWLEKGGALWERMSRGLLEGPPNVLQVFRPPADDAKGGLRGQAYGMGGFRCEPDEALVVELAPPACRHWSVSLASWCWESIDFATRQTSLNGHQARLDPDGAFRAVVAHQDPGIPNWLDTAGHRQGTLAARFLLASAAPEVRFRVVPHADVRSALPADTPRVTPAERAASLARRRHAALARYRR